jgi:hypothetical protein
VYLAFDLVLLVVLFLKSQNRISIFGFRGARTRRSERITYLIRFVPLRQAGFGLTVLHEDELDLYCELVSGIRNDEGTELIPLGWRCHVMAS